MKNKKNATLCHVTIRTVPKSNWQIVERGNIETHKFNFKYVQTSTQNDMTFV